MKILSTFLFLCMCIGIQAQTYVRNFESKANDKKVGAAKAVKIDNGDVVQYKVDSKVIVHALFTITIEYKAQSSYKAGVMISSSASVYINDRLQNSVVTQKTGDFYTIVEDEHTTKLYEEIAFSTTKMYFNKPEDQRSVYSESEGIMKPVVKTSEGKFKVKDPENADNITIYGYSSDQGVNDIEITKTHMPTLKMRHVRVAEEPKED